MATVGKVRVKVEADVSQAVRELRRLGHAFPGHRPYFCRHCWREERTAGATRRVAWNVARGKAL